MSAPKTLREWNRLAAQGRKGAKCVICGKRLAARATDRYPDCHAKCAKLSGARDAREAATESTSIEIAIENADGSQAVVYRVAGGRHE